MGTHILLAVLLAAGPVHAAMRTASRPATEALTSARSTGQEAWRGLRIPGYPGANGLSVSTDDDEYEASFRSSDSVQQVFDFYRDLLVRQGFRVRSSATQDDGRTIEADLTRSRGGRDDSVELDVKSRNGRFEVEIEFDD